jgi:hypothetical protein
LDHAEETGGTNGKALRYPSQVNQSFITNITYKVSEIKNCGYISDSCGTDNDCI